MLLTKTAASRRSYCFACMSPSRAKSDRHLQNGSFSQCNMEKSDLTVDVTGRTVSSPSQNFARSGKPLTSKCRALANEVVPSQGSINFRVVGSTRYVDVRRQRKRKIQAIALVTNPAKEFSWTQLHHTTRQHGRQLCLRRLVGTVSMNNYGLHIVTQGHVHHPKIAKEQQTDILFQICYNLLNTRSHTH